MKPTTTCGRDRGGNPFSIANAVKPSKAPITLASIPDGRLSTAEGEALRERNIYLSRELAKLQHSFGRMSEQLASFERLIGSTLTRAAGEVA